MPSSTTLLFRDFEILQYSYLKREEMDFFQKKSLKAPFLRNFNIGTYLKEICVDYLLTRFKICISIFDILLHFAYRKTDMTSKFVVTFLGILGIVKNDDISGMLGKF